MKTPPQNTPHNAPRFVNAQYRTINIKTTSKEALEAVMKAVADKPNCRCAWMEHPAEGETPAHFHFVASFTSPVRLADALRELARLDPHNYVKPCRNFRASVRYLAHLDNPEKVQLDPAKIALVGDWDGVNLQTLFERHGATADIAAVLGALRQYLEETGGVTASGGAWAFRKIRFAVWLDSHGYSSRKAFAMVRMMGLEWEELVADLLDEEQAREAASALDEDLAEERAALESEEEAHPLLASVG